MQKKWQRSGVVGVWDAEAQEVFLRALLRVAVISALESPGDGHTALLHDRMGRQQPLPHYDTIQPQNWYRARVKIRDEIRGTTTVVSVRIEVLRRLRSRNYVMCRLWASVFPAGSRCATTYGGWLTPEARIDPVEHRGSVCNSQGTP